MSGLSIGHTTISITHFLANSKPAMSSHVATPFVSKISFSTALPNVEGLGVRIMGFVFDCIAKDLGVVHVRLRRWAWVFVFDCIAIG